MLIEFRVENHRSLRDEQALTMEAGRVGDEADKRPRLVPGVSEGLLTVAALYGANASGKSNVVSALSFMRDAVLFSHRTWAPDEGVPRDPFAWGPKRTEPSLFEVTLLLSEVRYEYGFLASDESILEEWLYAWPNDKKQIWYERDGGTFKFGDNLKGENKLIEKVTRPNALFLSSAVQHEHAQLRPLYSWFRSMTTLNRARGSYSRQRRKRDFRAIARLLKSDPRQLSLFDEYQLVEPILARFVGLLRNADVGIVDLGIDKMYGGIRVKHQSDFDDSWLPLDKESRGTQTMFQLALPMVSAIDDGSLVLVDELEASLHPALAKEIVRQFNNPATNPNNAQLIFTTHDTNLAGSTLGEPALRRDQIWLTEKKSDGATVLYPLTDYKPRKAENLERGYLQGRYGAIPFLAGFNLLGTASS